MSRLWDNSYLDIRLARVSGVQKDLAGCYGVFKHRFAGFRKRNAPFLVSFLYSNLSDMIDLLF